MQKISTNINRKLFLALPIVSVPVLLLFNCREYWLAALFFLLSVSATAFLQIISIKYFSNSILTVIGSSLSKIVFLTVIFLIAAKTGGFEHSKMIIAHVIAFLAAKFYEIKIIKLLNTKTVALNLENK